MRGLLSETVNHKFSAEGIALWVPTLKPTLGLVVADEHLPDLEYMFKGYIPERVLFGVDAFLHGTDPTNGGLN